MPKPEIKMASTALPPKLDMSDPNVRRIVYNMYRGMLGTYNDKANDIVDSMPRQIVTEDAGIYAQLEAMINSAQEARPGGPPPPPPPPGMPGALPSRRIQSEIPERGSEPPAAIQNAMMTKDKKPFTYTPGGLDLSEIKSPRMARRVNRNAQAQEIHGQHAPSHQLAPPGPPVATPNQMPTQVFPPAPPPPPASPPQNLPKIRGFDPADILSRPSRLQPGAHTGPPPPKPVNEPGLAYGPSQNPRSQLGSIYIPPVSQQESSTPSSHSSSPYSGTAEPRKGPTPWVSPKPEPPRADVRPPQQTGSRIIPIKVEGRDDVTPPANLQEYKPPGQQARPGTGGRVIPIQMEASPIPQQSYGNHQRQNLPPPEGTSQWAPVQQRPKDQTDRGQFLPPLGSNQEYGSYNTAGVPLSALRKMQLSDEDKSLMDKLKTQADRYHSQEADNPNENSLYKGSHIPSKVFKILDKSVDDEQYLHRETDPRYRGAAIPSRAFRMLQNMTDTAGDGPPVPRGPSRGPPSRPSSATPQAQEAQPASEQQVQEPRMYTGGSIPSRSFRMLQAMTGQENPARASPNSPSGRETPVGRWCPSPAPDPYWGYYPPDPYAYYNYLSELNAAYGYPPPPPPPSFLPPPFNPQRFANYTSDNEENGYSSTDELGQYYQNYRRSMGYPPIVEPTPEQPAESKEDSEEESISSSEEEETDTDDTEVEEKEKKKKSSKTQGSLKAFKSVSDVNVYTSESTATMTNDEWEDCESKIGDDESNEEETSEEETTSEEEEEEEEEEDSSPPPPPEEIIPHQLSIIFEESEYSDVESMRRAARSVTSETASTATTVDQCLEEAEEESDDENLMSESSVTVRLPLQFKFSKNSEATTVIVGDSETKTENVDTKDESSSDEEFKEAEQEEYKSDEADVSFTISIPTRSNSIVTVVEDEKKTIVEAIKEEEEVETEVTVNVCLPKPKRDTHEKTEENWSEETKTETEGTYEQSVNKLEDMISTILETTKEKLVSKDSVDESEEDDSGVTDMSTKPQNSDTESEYTELNKMTQYQRASTHSRLFKLLQDECEKEGDDDDDDDSKSESISTPPESLSARKEKLTLPLTSAEVESQSSSSGVTSPSSPTVTDRLVKELIQSLLHKKKGKKFRKLPMAKLHAAALRILQEDMDPYDTSSNSASGEDFMSPVRHSQIPPEDNIYGENYYEYLDYYNSWRHPPGYYEYDGMAPRPYPYPPFKAKCPRVPPPPPNYPIRAATPTFYRHFDDPTDSPMTFADKRDRVAKVFEKS